MPSAICTDHTNRAYIHTVILSSFSIYRAQHALSPYTTLPVSPSCLLGLRCLSGSATFSWLVLPMERRSFLHRRAAKRAPRTLAQPPPPPPPPPLGLPLIGCSDGPAATSVVAARCRWQGALPLWKQSKSWSANQTVSRASAPAPTHHHNHGTTTCVCHNRPG